MVLSVDKRQKINKILQIIFPLFLALYPLRHIRYGVGWTDAGYNYGNFAYIEHMDDMWLFATYLGNVFGNMLTKLPFGNTMMGLNFYTGLLISVLAVGGYFFFVKEVKLPPVIVFIGEFLAISLCWCPTALLYNYLSYVFLGIGAFLLYMGLMKKRGSRVFLILAGVMLGCNVFVRFPNLSNMALIVAVWAMGIIRKEKFIQVLKQTFFCILGYLLGLGICFGGISLKYGAGDYIQGIIRLLTMPSEAADYSIMVMVMQQINNYLQNLIWLGYLCAIMLIGAVVYQLLPKSWKWIKNIGYVVLVFCGFYFLWTKNMFNMEYNTYMSMFQWAVMLLTATWMGGLVVVFGKGFSNQEKLLAGLNIIIILITPLGSNNHLYSAINNLFFVVPFTIWLLYRFWKWLPVAWKVKKREIFTYPVKTMMVCMFGMILLQITLFAQRFVFLETTGGENSSKNLHAKVENNDVLKGMRMEEERAAIITEISTYVKEQGLQGREVILYGQIPAMSYYLEMPFAISSWADLPSYNFSVMETDLKEVQKGIEAGKAAPVILMDRTWGIYTVNGPEGLEDLGADEDVIKDLKEDKKLLLLEDMIEKYNYTVTFENERFVLFQADADM